MIDKLTNFLWDNCEYLHEKNTKEVLRDAVQKHWEYKTIVVQYDENGICGVCRFEIVDTKEAFILDVAVRKDLRHKDILQRLLLQGLTLYPNIKQLRFYSQDKKKEFVSPVNMLLAKEK